MGKSRRSIACRSMSTAAILGDVGRGSLTCLDLPQVAAQLAQLVAQLGRVLEAQLLGGKAHLLLELDHHPLELMLGQLSASCPRPSAPFAPARNLRLRLQELGNIGDALDDR